MLLGFISLLLTVFQRTIVKICVPHDITEHLLPCSLSLKSSGEENSSHAKPETTSHLRRLLSEGSATQGYCAAKVTTFISFIFFRVSYKLTDFLVIYVLVFARNIIMIIFSLWLCWGMLIAYI